MPRGEPSARGELPLAINTLRLGILINIAARLFSALLMLAFVPIFVRLLGTEAYGLIVLATAGISILGNVDLGLSITLNREVAAIGTADAAHEGLASLARTLEILYWAGACVVSVAGFAFAPAITLHWLNLGSMSPASVIRALRLMAPALALQLPVTLYSSVLLGQGRQAALSIIASITASTRTAGAAILLLFHPSIEMYFAAQLATTAAQAIFMQHGFRKSFPAAPAALKAGWHEFKRVWRFSAGVAIISATGVLMSQMDKVLISWLLPLRDVGYYGIGWALTGGLRILTTPVFNALFPRLTKAAAADHKTDIERLYQGASQLMSVLIWPPTCLLLLFSQPILYLWTRDAELARISAPALGLLAIGSALNGVMLMPFALQLAHGWTRLTINIYVGSSVLMFPGLYLATSWFGLTGAAAIWPILNLGYMLVGIKLMHRRLLPRDMWRWYLRDCAAPFASALMVCVLLMEWRPDNWSWKGQIAWFALSYVLASLASVLSAPMIRSALHTFLLRLLKTRAAAG